MTTTLYSVKNIVDTFYDHDINAVIVEWKDLTTNEHFRKSCEAQIDALEKYNSGILIINSSKTVGVPYPEDQNWLITVLYPKIKKLRSHVIINIIPENKISTLGVKTWVNSGGKNNINFIDVKTMSEALALAKTYQNITA